MNNQIIEINGIKMVDKDGELYFVQGNGDLVRALELENYKDYIMEAIEYYQEKLEELEYGEMNIFKAMFNKLKTEKEYRKNIIICIVLLSIIPMLASSVLKLSVLGPETTILVSIIFELLIAVGVGYELTNDIFMERKETKVYKQNIEFLKKKLKKLEIELSKNGSLLLERVPETIITELRRFEEYNPNAKLDEFEPKEETNIRKRGL